jgi:hypothetical protein
LGAKECHHFVEDKLHCCIIFASTKTEKTIFPVSSTTNRINDEKNLDSWSLVLGTRELQMMIPLESMGRQMSYIRL